MIIQFIADFFIPPCVDRPTHRVPPPLCCIPCNCYSFPRRPPVSRRIPQSHFACPYSCVLRVPLQDEVLPGVRFFLKSAREAGLKIALGSASKNSAYILEKLRLTAFFDAIIDGKSVAKAKPDPEVFLTGARVLGLAAAECCVFEDAIAGIEAAHRAGMKAVGVGAREHLAAADIVIPGFNSILPQDIICRI